MKKERGFTLIEVLVSLAIFGIIMSVLVTMLVQNQNSARVNELMIEAEQNTRVVNDFLSRHLRSTGYGRDLEGGQLSIVYAGPFTVLVNSDFDVDLNEGDRREAYDPTIGPTLPSSYYNPGIAYERGAETIVLGLDVNLDGNITASDMTEGALATSNPNDFMVVRRVFGAKAGSNGGDTTEIAMVRGPWKNDLYDPGVVSPLFQYWLDRDEDGVVDELWGDDNHNDSLDVGEYDFAPITLADSAFQKPVLKFIREITLVVKGETPGKDKGYSLNNGYRPVKMSSGIDVTRNEPPFYARPQRREVLGRVYWINGSGDTLGFEDAKVSVTPHNQSSDTFGVARSLSQGDYHFFVNPDTYNVHLGIPLYHTLELSIPDPPRAYLVENFEDEVVFEIAPDDTIGFIEGWVYIDRNGNRTWDSSSESTMAGVSLSITTLNINHTFTDSVYKTRTNLEGFYHFTLPGDTTTDIPTGRHWDTLRVHPPLHWASTDPYWVRDGDSLFGEAVISIPLDWESDTVNCGIYDIRWDSLAPSVVVTHVGDTIPPCEDRIEQDDTVTIRWTTADLLPDSAMVEFSTDGILWDTLSLLLDSGNYEWVVEESTTTSARIRVTAKDMNNNTGSDTSCIFEVVPRGGAQEFLLYFTDDTTGTGSNSRRILSVFPPPASNEPDTAWSETNPTDSIVRMAYLHDPAQYNPVAWITPVGSVDSLPAGRWQFIRWGFKKQTSDSVYIFWNVFKTDTEGNYPESLFSTIDTVDAQAYLTDTLTVDTVFFSAPQYPFHPDTHRLLIEVWARDQAATGTTSPYFLYDARYDSADSTKAPSVRLMQ